jgi:hypothetical protein
MVLGKSVIPMLLHSAPILRISYRNDSIFIIPLAASLLSKYFLQILILPNISRKASSWGKAFFVPLHLPGSLECTNARRATMLPCI